MSDSVRDFLSFAPNTIAGDWAWVVASWLLALVAFGGYWLRLRALQKQVEKAEQT